MLCVLTTCFVVFLPQSPTTADPVVRVPRALAVNVDQALVPRVGDPQDSPAAGVAVVQGTKATPSGDFPELAKRIRSATVFVHCGDLTQLDRDFDNVAISKLFNDPEVWEFLRTNPEFAKFENVDSNKLNAPVLAWYDVLRKDADIPEALWKQFIELCQGGLLGGEMSCAIDIPRSKNAKEPSHDHEMPKVYVMGSAGHDPSKVDGFLASLAEHVRSVEADDRARRTALDNIIFYEFGAPPRREGTVGDDPIFCVCRKGNRVMMTAPEPEVMVNLLTMRPEVSLADNIGFQEAHAFLGNNKNGLYVYVDGPSITREDRNPKGELAHLGLSGLRWIGFTMEAAGESIRHRVEVRADVKRGIPTLFTTKGDFQLASFLPERTLASAQMGVDGPKTFTAFRKMFRDFGREPETPRSGRYGRFDNEFDEAMAEMRHEVGTDVKEILSLVGDEIAFAVVPPESGFVPDAYLIVKAKDVSAAERCKQIVEEAFRRTQPREELRTVKFQGNTISYIQVEESPFFPSMFVDADRFVLGSNLAAVKRYIQFRTSNAPALSAKPAFRESMRAVNDGDATGYVWIDWPSVTNFVYGNMSALLPFVVGAESGRQYGPHGDPVKEGPVRVSSRRRSASAELDFDWAKLPSVETVSKYVPPQIVRVRIDKQGYSLDSRAFF